MSGNGQRFGINIEPIYGSMEQKTSRQKTILSKKEKNISLLLVGRNGDDCMYTWKLMSDNKR